MRWQVPCSCGEEFLKINVETKLPQHNPKHILQFISWYSKTQNAFYMSMYLIYEISTIIKTINKEDRNIIQSHNNVLQIINHIQIECEKYSANTVSPTKFTQHTDWMWGIFYKILLVWQNIVMALNNVMTWEDNHM